MPYTGKRRGTMETYRNEEQMQCLTESEGCSTLPVSLYLADRVSITGAQAALAVMLSRSLVGSLAKLEVFSENTRQMKMTAEQRYSKGKGVLIRRRIRTEKKYQHPGLQSFSATVIMTTVRCD